MDLTVPLENRKPAWAGNSIAWGRVKDGILTMHREDGEWFRYDVEAGRELTEPQPTETEAVAAMHAYDDTLETVSKCYFIGADEGPIKIGHSVDVPGRLRAIQSCSPLKLSVLALASGGESRETTYHYQFRDYRLHGEWFERCPEILEEIERLSV